MAAFSKVRIAFDLWRAQRQGEAGLAARRERRFKKLLWYARTHSPFYQDLYKEIKGVSTL